MHVQTAHQLAIGDTAPNFAKLLGTDGKRYSLASFGNSPILVLAFMGNGCPTAKAHQSELVAIGENYQRNGVQVVAVNSNNPSLSPYDTLDAMTDRARESKYSFPYLKDENQRLARGCGAVCTPHVFVFDSMRKLRYRGRITDSRDPARATSHDLKEALGDLFAGKSVKTPETQPFGCSIVW